MGASLPSPAAAMRPRPGDLDRGPHSLLAWRTPAPQTPRPRLPRRCWPPIVYELAGRRADADAALAAVRDLTNLDCYRTRGDVYDLAPMFTRLNRGYFAGRLRRPRLGWSSRTWRTQFGCFDPALDQIVMNRWLDRSCVPRYAVEYVLFHEMLHVKHPLRAARCGIEAHSLKFRLEEKRYANYERARKFLDRLP